MVGAVGVFGLVSARLWVHFRPMGKVIKMGLAQAVLNRNRERRQEMVVKLTKEAIALLYCMFCSPTEQWDVKEQYKGADFKARKEFSALAKWVDVKLLSEEQPPEDEKALQALNMLKQVYDPQNPRPEMKEQVWRVVQSFGQRRLFMAGEFRVKKEYVERIQDVFDHYVKKESKTLMPTHFGDLERALKGEGAPSADDVAEEAVQS